MCCRCNANSNEGRSGVAPPTSLLSPSPIPIGTRVELHGLKAKSELNGQRGVVAGFVPHRAVQSETGDGRGPFRWKVGNLKKA